MTKFQSAVAALLFAATLPALAGTVMTAAHAQEKTGTSAIASDSAKQKATPTAKGGLVNTDVTPRQAKAAAHQTNRQIARGQITPDKTDR